MNHDDVVHDGQHTRWYWTIGSALFVLTVATVAASFIHLNVLLGTVIGLSIAVAKGGLVALFFMHLSHERRLVYGVLFLTVVFFFALLFLPLYGSLDSYASAPIYVP